MGKFTNRSYQKEIMDDLEFDGPILEQTLKELRTINKLLGGNHVTTTGLAKIIHRHPASNYSIADIGCGGGDMIRVMADWAKKKKIDMNFVGIDANPNTIRMAKQKLNDLSNVTFQAQNVFDKEFTDDAVDIITCTLFTHHFTDEELIKLFSAIKSKARIGIVVNDLHRHPLAYHSISILTKFFSKSPMVRNDGPLSVLRGFKRAEMASVLKQSGIVDFKISWNWAFRWQILCIFD